jgi:hypothetical protein
MPSLDGWTLVPEGPGEPPLADPEAWAARIRLRLAERRRYQLPAPRSLAELRRSCRVSQEILASRLGRKQARLSRFERHPDPRLGALRAYVAALGGTLTLLARFPDRDAHLQIADP